MEFDGTILGRQANAVRNLMNDGKYSEAYYSLQVISELWHSHNYGYMYTELYKRARNILQRKENHA